MFKIIATKFAIFCFHADLLLFFGQWIHFNDLWKYIWYQFFLPFQMTKEDIHYISSTVCTNISGMLGILSNAQAGKSTGFMQFFCYCLWCRSNVFHWDEKCLKVVIKYHKNRQRLGKVLELHDIVFIVVIVFRWWIFKTLRSINTAVWYVGYQKMFICKPYR